MGLSSETSRTVSRFSKRRLNFNDDVAEAGRLNRGVDEIVPAQNALCAALSFGDRIDDEGVDARELFPVRGDGRLSSTSFCTMSRSLVNSVADCKSMMVAGPM